MKHDIFNQDGPPDRLHRFALYLPSEDRDGAQLRGFGPISAATEELLCGLLGGVTSYPATGAHQRDGGGVHRERVMVLESFCAEATWRSASPVLGALVKLLARELEQECLAGSLDRRMTITRTTRHSAHDYTTPRT